MNSSRQRRLVDVALFAAIVALALFLRLYYQQVTVVDQPVRADAAQYARIAWNLRQHGVVSMAPPADTPPVPDSYRGPGYPLLLAGAMGLAGTDDPRWYGYALTAQALLGAGTVALIMLIAGGFLAPAYVRAVGLLYAVWPHAITLSGYLLTETLFGFTLALGVYLLTRALASRRVLTFASAGAAFSFAALVNPIIIPFAPLAGALLLRRAPRPALVFMLCAALLPAWWAVRGAGIPAAPNATSSYRLAENLLIGAEPDFPGAYRGDPVGLAVRARVDEALDAYAAHPAALGPLLLERLAAEPVRLLAWYLLEKPAALWTWSVAQGVGDVYVYPTPVSPFELNPWYRALHALCYGLNTPLMVAAFGMLGVVLYRAWRGPAPPDALWLTALLVGYATAIHMVLTPDARYAVPFRGFEIALAVGLVATLVPWVLARRRAALPPGPA